MSFEMNFSVGLRPAASFGGLAVIHRLRRLRAVHCDATITASAGGVRLEGLWPVMRADDAMEFAAELLIAAAQADEMAAGHVEQFAEAAGRC